MSLMGNDIWTLEVRVSTVFDYWDAYVGGEKIKPDGLKPCPFTHSNHINDPSRRIFSYTYC